MPKIAPPARPLPKAEIDLGDGVKLGLDAENGLAGAGRIMLRLKIKL